MAAPAEDGRENRVFECACGQVDSVNVALHRTNPLEPAALRASATAVAQAKPVSAKADRGVRDGAATARSPRARAETARSPVKAEPNRSDRLQASVQDAMLSVVPSLRAFAISLCRDVDRADDLVQETLMRALANIRSFQPGTNMSAWLFTILRNQFLTEYRKRRREVEDSDGSYVESLKSPPEQQSRVDFEEFRAALATLPVEQREALLLIGASGFSYADAASICKAAVGTIKSRVHRARMRLCTLLALEGVGTFGPDQATFAVMTAVRRG
ncbi:MAG: sigma-70 family RNA polymerase sigma factor [Rhodoplanes sp.]|nr:sigma-70 family RNA polymerase sigma factor [Rhodoplanes sp.]